MSPARRVLLLEDEANVRRVIERMLHNERLEIDAAATLAEALDRLAAARYDLLISDIRLPDGDGTQAVLRYRREQPGGAVLILTGAPGGAAPDLSGEFSGCELLCKPFEAAQLKKAVRRALGRA